MALKGAYNTDYYQIIKLFLIKYYLKPYLV